MPIWTSRGSRNERAPSMPRIRLRDSRCTASRVHAKSDTPRAAMPMSPYQRAARHSDCLGAIASHGHARNKDHSHQKRGHTTGGRTGGAGPERVGPVKAPKMIHTGGDCGGDYSAHSFIPNEHRGRCHVYKSSVRSSAWARATAPAPTLHTHIPSRFGLQGTATTLPAEPLTILTIDCRVPAGSEPNQPPPYGLGHSLTILGEPVQRGCNNPGGRLGLDSASSVPPGSKTITERSSMCQSHLQANRGAVPECGPRPHVANASNRVQHRLGPSSAVAITRSPRHATATRASDRQALHLTLHSRG